MDPDSFCAQRVGAGDVNGNGARWGLDPSDRFNHLLAHLLVDEPVAGAQELCRSESPLIAATDKERVLRSCLDASVDDNEPGVFAEANARDTPFRLLRDQPVAGEPVVLCAIRYIDLETLNTK